MKTPLQIEIVVAPQYLERLHEYIKLVYDRLCNSKHFSFSNFVISSDDEDNQPQDYPKINELIQYLSSINSAIELVSNIKSLKKISPINLQQLHIAVDVPLTHNILRLESEEDIDYMKEHALSWAINAVNTRHTTLDHHRFENIKNLKHTQPYHTNALINGRVFLHNNEYFLQNEKNSGCFQVTLIDNLVFPCTRARSYGIDIELFRETTTTLNLFDDLQTILRKGVSKFCLDCDIYKQYAEITTTTT